MKGRKPKLRVVGGSAKSLPPSKAAPLPPEWLSVPAKREWRRVAPELVRRGHLGADTKTTLESYCLAWGMAREAEAVLQREGQVITTDKGRVAHLAVRTLLSAMREARLLAAELGLTPMRRGTQEDASKGDDWEGMLG